VRTPRALGIARSTLYERVKDDGLTVPARADTNGDLVSPLPA
jgi:predicted DNA-binding transcriptional regulator AlpA